MNIPSRDELQNAILNFDTNKEAYIFLNISKKKFYQLKKEYAIPDYYNMHSDETIARHIMEFNHEHPTAGVILLKAYLDSKNIRVRRARLRNLVQQYDVNYEMRRAYHSRKITRRVYNAFGGMYLLSFFYINNINNY